MPKIIKNGVNYASGGADWLAQLGSEGFISNKPSLASGTGEDSIREGLSTLATGRASHAEGSQTEAVGDYSHTEGLGTISSIAQATHVQGKYNANYTNTNLVDVVGWGTQDARKNVSALTADGNLLLKGTVKVSANNDSTGGIELQIPSVTGGLSPGKTYNLTYNSNTANRMTWTESSIDANADWLALENSEGYIENKPNVLAGSDYDRSAVLINDLEHNDASGVFAHAEGTYTNASGDYSHAEGQGTSSQSVVASGKGSHAEGYLTKATGSYSHAEGSQTEAPGVGSHAEGIGTYAPNITGGGSSARGKWNVKSGNFIDVVGGGTNNNNRVNLSALTTSGQLILKNSVVIGAENNSTGGYVVPIPDDTIKDGQQYVMSYNSDTDTIEWTVLSASTNSYQRDPSKVTTDGPFTIYDGTTEPLASLGKVGDIYFKHS